MSDEPKFTGNHPMKRPLKVGTVTTVDMQTGEVIDVKRNAMTLLPPKPGTCPTCATDHPHDAPHNQQSLYYQMQFAATHGRAPTWSDAMSHCSDAVKAAWRPLLVDEMRRKGMPIPEDMKDVGEGGGR